MRDRHVGRAIDQEIEDALATLERAADDRELEDEQCVRLVDLLLERIVVDLTREAEEGRISRTLYTHEIRALVEQCRQAGLFGVL